jgi:hypothetical protein
MHDSDSETEQAVSRLETFLRQFATEILGLELAD